MNTLALPVRSPRRRSMGVRKTRLCATCSMLIKPATLKNALRLSAMLIRLSPGIPLWYQEGEFVRVEANSKEDAQRLWQRERQHMQDTLRQQKEQMMEDKKWLAKEERLLVGRRASLTFVKTLSVSLCPSEFNVALEATLNEASFDNINPLVHSRLPTSLKLNVPIVTVPKKGSTSISYKMNLPVLLQDPMGPEDHANPAVSVHA